MGDGLGLVDADPVDARSRRRPGGRGSSSRTTIATRIPISPPPSASCSWRKPAGAGPAQWCCSSRSSSRARIVAVSSGSAWSWPSTWSTPWTTSRASSSSSVPAWVGGLLGGDRRADHDVAEQHRDAAAAPGVAVVVVERERQHVGRAGLAEVLGVELGDLVAVDERQRQLAPPLLGLEHGAGEARPPVDVDVDLVLLVGAHHDHLVGERGEGGTGRLSHGRAPSRRTRRCARRRRRCRRRCGGAPRRTCRGARRPGPRSR